MSAEPALATRHPHSLFLAFDYGPKRLGVASGCRALPSARALTVLSGAAPRCYDAIAQLIREWAPRALVVGVPRHKDGRAHTMTERAQSFSRALQQRFALPVFEVDERFSTVEAERERAGEPADAAAAAILLEQFFREDASAGSL